MVTLGVDKLFCPVEVGGGSVETPSDRRMDCRLVQEGVAPNRAGW